MEITDRECNQNWTVELIFKTIELKPLTTPGILRIRTMRCRIQVLEASTDLWGSSSLESSHRDGSLRAVSALEQMLGENERS